MAQMFSGSSWAISSHLPESGDLISATDVCTLMLYEKVCWMGATLRLIG